jgi:hypothetical protein
MGMAGEARGEAVVNEFDVVLIYDGAHYNALSWKRSAEKEEDRDTHEEEHFDNDFADAVAF